VRLDTNPAPFQQRLARRGWRLEGHRRHLPACRAARDMPTVRLSGRSVRERAQTRSAPAPTRTA